MPNDSYQDALRTATDELSELMEQREELQARLYQIQHRINVLRDGIFGLCTMVGEDPYTTRPELFGNDQVAPEVGFTDAVRAVLRNSGKFLTPVDVRDELRRTGFDIDKYRNPLASIHQILRRLTDSGEVEPNDDEDKKVYRWKKQHPVTVLARTRSGKIVTRYIDEGLTPSSAVRPGNSRDPKPATDPTDLSSKPPTSKRTRVTPPHVPPEPKHTPGQQQMISEPQKRPSVTYEQLGLKPPKKEGSEK